MAVDIHNYEAYFLDYLEGSLPEAESRALMAFLDEHPHLRKELESYDKVVMDPDVGIQYDKKQSLKRSEETGIPMDDQRAIAALEGDSDRRDADEELLAMYQHTRLSADPVIRFTEKASLKKRSVIIPPYVRYAAAAIIVMLIAAGAWFTFSPETGVQRNTHPIARLDSKPPASINLHTNPYRPVRRDTEHMQMTYANREAVRIDRVQYALAEKVSPSPAMAVANFPAYLTPSAIQYEVSGMEDLAAEGEAKEKTLMGKILSGLANTVKAPFESRFERPEKDNSRDKFTFWDLAELGLKGVNAIGDHDYTLVREYNENGKLKGVVVLDE
jgi:hypothetical protein